MNKSYLNSEKNIVLSLKPSKAIQMLLMVLFLAFSGFVNAQCSITSSTNASTIACSGSPSPGTSPLGSCSGILYIGDGSTTMTLGIDVDLDLTCLGPIQMIFRDKATIDFSVGSNKNLKLAAGSSIEFQTGSGIHGDSSCSASDLINIGSEKVASCNGGGALTDFGTLVTNGGYSSINASASPSSICNSGSSTITAVASPSSGATYKWYTVASGGTAIVGTTGNTFTTGTISATTTYYVEASYTTPTYTTIRKAVTVTVYTTPSTPTVGVITQPNCVSSTGSVVLSGLPASGTINQTGTVIANYPITGTSMTISGLAAGTYNFKVSNGTCPSSSATGNVVINAAPTTTAVWNGSGWTNGPPTISQAVQFTGNYNSSGDLSACSCTVTSGVVVFSSSNTLTITNWVHVDGGSLTFDNNASLVQINDVANTGNIVYKRITPSLIETDYTYWSSPVAGQSLNISPDYAYGTFYSYDFFADNWAAASLSTTMVAGNGYIIRGQKPDNSSYNITGTFTGVPNNGDLSVNVGTARGTSILLGNPYPSALDADAFLAANADVIDGILYFWTHNTAIQLASGIEPGKAGSGVYAYTSDDYASYNAVGGTATAAAPSGSTGGVNTNIPSGKIASGQGFLTTINGVIVGSNTIVYNNLMRLGSSGANNSQFFKTRKQKGAVEKNRIWLNLSNKEGAFKQTLLGYVTGATNENETRFDGESFDGNEFVDFYSVNQDKNLVIQGRALPFDENDEVSLGYRSAIEGTFNINIDQVDGLLVNQDVFIEDKLTNTEFDLKSGNYTFSTIEGTFNDRFVLKYKSSSKTLGTSKFDVVANKVLVSVKNKQIKINSSAEMIRNVVVYDVEGRQICEKDKVNSNGLLIADLASASQTLIVKTTLENGTIVTDKIIF